MDGGHDPLLLGSGCAHQERSSLIRQLGFVYSALRRTTDVQIQMHITSLPPTPDASNQFSQECSAYGLYQWKVHVHAEPFWDVFSSEEIVVLTPDAEEEIDHFDVSYVYVIGGLVDRTVLKAETFDQARQHTLRTQRLPLKKYLPGFITTALNVNTVFEIMQWHIRTQDWENTFLTCIPQRRLGHSGTRARRRQQLRAQNEADTAVETTALILLEQHVHFMTDHDDGAVMTLPNDLYRVLQQLQRRHRKPLEAVFDNEELCRSLVFAEGASDGTETSNAQLCPAETRFCGRSETFANDEERAQRIASEAVPLPQIAYFMTCAELQTWYRALCLSRRRREEKKLKESQWRCDFACSDAEESVFHCFVEDGSS